MLKKLAVGLLMGAILFAAILLRQFNPLIIDMLALILLTLAGLEVAKALGRKYTTPEAPPILPLVAFFPLVSCGVFFLGIYFQDGLGLRFLNGLTMMLILDAIVLAVLLIVRAATKTKEGKDRMFVTIFSLIYPLTLGIFMIALNRLGSSCDLSAKTEFGATPFALMLCISAASDALAYFGGSLFKGPKLAPSISPHKTISGAICGLIGGFLGALALLAVSTTGWMNALPLPFAARIDSAGFWVSAVLLGILGSAFTQAGDLVASSIKRDVGIKDYGKILGCHGGVMDRIDGWLFNSFFVYLYITIALMI